MEARSNVRVPARAAELRVASRPGAGVVALINAQPLAVLDVRDAPVYCTASDMQDACCTPLASWVTRNAALKGLAMQA